MRSPKLSGTSAMPGRRPCSTRCSGDARRVARRRPPRDHLRLGPGQGDVEQAQPLARLLVGPAAPRGHPSRRRWCRRRRRSGGPRRRGRAASTASGRCGRRATAGRRPGTAGPCWRGSSRAGPRPRRSRGGGCARPCVRCGPRATWSRSQREHRHQPEPLGQGHLVERLADVAQVGEQPLSADAAQHAARQARARSRPPAPLRHPGSPKTSAHERSVSATSSVSSSPPAVELLGGTAEEAGQRRRPDPCAAVGLLQPLEQQQPLVGRRRWRRRCRRRRSRRGPRPPAAPPGPPRGRRGGRRSRRRREARGVGRPRWRR